MSDPGLTPFAMRDAPLAPYTTFRVGGPADWLVLAEGFRPKAAPQIR